MGSYNVSEGVKLVDGCDELAGYKIIVCLGLIVGCGVLKSRDTESGGPTQDNDYGHRNDRKR